MQPFFLTVEGRSLFCLQREANGGSHGVLVLPPLAEDMNQTRSFSAVVGERLANDGALALSFDLSCTGDSTGEFVDATWSGWAADVRGVLGYLAERVSVVHVIAARSASLLLRAVLEAPGRTVERVCLLDPVLDGDAFVTDFLRVKVARSLFEGKRETLVTLREQLAGGRPVEVAGYELSPELYAGLCRERIDAALLGKASRLRVVTSKAYADGEHAARLGEVISPLGAERIDVEFDIAWAADRPDPAPEFASALTGGLGA